MQSVSDLYKNIVGEALLLLKAKVIAEHAEDLASQPQNGKSVATVADDEADSSYNRRIDEIEAVIDLFLAPETNIKVTEDTPSQSDFALNNNLGILSTANKSEPYINPFDGTIIYPPTADAPGSSKVLSRDHQDSSSFAESGASIPKLGETDQVQQKSISPRIHRRPIPSIVSETDQVHPKSISPIIKRKPVPSNTSGRIFREEKNGENLSEVGTKNTQNWDLTLHLFEEYFDAQIPSRQTHSGSDPTKSHVRAVYDAAISSDNVGGREDVTPVLDSFLKEQENDFIRELSQFEQVVCEIEQQDQKQVEADLAYAQSLEEEWNRKVEAELHDQQLMAQQIAEQEEQKETAEELKELRRLQESMQAEQDWQIETDRQLALELSGNGSEASVNPWRTQIPVRFLQEKPNRPIHPPKFPHMINKPIRNKPKSTDYASKNFKLTLQSQTEWQKQWQKEMNQNEALARQAREEITLLEAQAQRDADYARQEHQRQQEEYRRLQEEAERLRREEEVTRRARLVKCSVCSDSMDCDLACQLACQHHYCRECITQSIVHAVKNKTAFTCCKRRIQPQALATFLPADIMKQYTTLEEELDTSRPAYCSNRSCAKFIPPANYTGDTATCPACQRVTCRLCRTRAHDGVCKEDSAGQALLRLGNRMKWKACPSCGTMVERDYGCLHMTCRCGQHFCYNCGKPSSRCSGKCQR